jgi:hypothetical protein
MTIVYRIITAAVIALVVWNLFRDRRLTGQITAALVLLPLILRLLMIR